MRQATLKFHKSLWKFTEGAQEHTLEADSYLYLINNCIELFPKLKRIFKQISSSRHSKQELTLIVDGKILPLENLMFIPKGKDITLCPIIGGSGKVFTIIAIVVILAFTIWNPAGLVTVPGLTVAVTGGSIAAGTAGLVVGAGLTTLGSLLVGIAFSLALSLIAPTPSGPGRAEAAESGGARAANEVFGGLVNTSAQRTIIGLTYGLNRLAGQFISGYVKTINHGKEDTVSVEKQFPLDPFGITVDSTIISDDDGTVTAGST